MIYFRFVIDTTDGASLHGQYLRVSHLWENGDGTSMFRVECDDPGFESLMAAHAATTITVLPSLNAPASALAGRAAAYLTQQGVTPAPGDTVLNVLRRIRDARGLTMFIDQPH